MTKLVLIHGLGGTPAEMEPFRKRLGGQFEIVAPTLLSHGERPLAEVGGFDAIIQDLVIQLDDAGRGPAYFLGYSVGGYFALYLAARFPELALGVAAIGAKLFFDGNAIDYVRHVTTPERLLKNAPARRAALESRYGDSLLQALQRGISLFERLRDDPPLTGASLGGVRCPVLLISGEQDPLASGSEMREAAKLLRKGRLGLFPGRAHPIDNVPLDRVIRAVQHFLRDVEQGSFEAGQQIDIAEMLVTGGMTDAETRAFIGKDRRKD